MLFFTPPRFVLCTSGFMFGVATLNSFTLHHKVIRQPTYKTMNIRCLAIVVSEGPCDGFINKEVRQSCVFEHGPGTDVCVVDKLFIHGTQQIFNCCKSYALALEIINSGGETSETAVQYS